MKERQIEFERNLMGSYMKIRASDDAVLDDIMLDEKIILGKEISGMLSVEKCFVNGVGEYWYCITGKQSIESICQLKSLKAEFIERLLISICKLLENMEWNLLKSNCLLLNPELIYINNSNQELFFTMFPGGTENIQQSFLQLMEYLLTKIDHKDSTTVDLAYEIYEKALDEGYCLEDIRNSIVANHTQVECEDRNKAEVPFDTPNDFPDQCSKQLKISRETKKINHEYIFEKAVNKWNSWKQHIFERGHKIQKEAVVYPEDVEEVLPRESLHPTVCLTDYREHPEGMLLYEGYEQMENIMLPTGISKIGKGSDVDIVIKKQTISHFHAQIKEENKEYYLEDMNSTNGTYINDQALSYRESRKLNSNDIVRFADVKYRFV